MCIFFNLQKTDGWKTGYWFPSFPVFAKKGLKSAKKLKSLTMWFCTVLLLMLKLKSAEEPYGLCGRSGPRWCKMLLCFDVGLFAASLTLLSDYYYILACPLAPTPTPPQMIVSTAALLYVHLSVLRSVSTGWTPTLFLPLCVAANNPPLHTCYLFLLCLFIFMSLSLSLPPSFLSVSKLQPRRLQHGAFPGWLWQGLL